MDNSYYIYKNALDADIYVKREDGSNFEGLYKSNKYSLQFTQLKRIILICSCTFNIVVNYNLGWCWPGNSAYADFFLPKAREFFAEQYKLENYKGSTLDLYT